MQSTSKQEQLRQLLKEQHASLQQTFPPDRARTMLALVHASNQSYLENRQNDTASLQKALALGFSMRNIEVDMPADTLDIGADSILQACSRLAEAERVLGYCDSGFMHMQQGSGADYNVWVASKKIPTEWREHDDLLWWTNLLEQTHTPEMQVLSLEKAHIQQQLTDFVTQWDGQASALYKTTQTIDEYYYQLGALHVKRMAAFTTYPASTRIGGCTFAVYRDVLGMLIGLTLKQMNMHRDMSLLHNDALLIETLVARLGLDTATVRPALDAYTLDADNVQYHTSTTEVPSPPLIRLDKQQRVVSLAGLLTYPLFFLTRELKRKYSFEYHTASQLREEVFRQDVYSLFADKRFVKSAGRIELRDTKGSLITDVDALIFDRKTGALAIFELKSQDPFAYSPQERTRQRDYFYGASKQVIAMNEWVKRNGANALLSRLDSAQVKRLKAQNVYIFVLGRYLAHFFDGSPFDARAAWGTWPQVLRLVHGEPFGATDTNPIQSLHNKLTKDTPLALADKSLAFQEIVIEDKRIRVYPSFNAYRNINE